VSTPRQAAFYALGSVAVFLLLFLYGPMLVIFILSFQGPDGGVTFPMVGSSFHWFYALFTDDQIGDVPQSLVRSLVLAAIVAMLTVVLSVSAGLGFRRRFPGSGALFYLAIASLVMPGLLVGFGIAVGAQMIGVTVHWFTTALGAQLTWTLPFGLLIMFAMFGRFDRSYEEAAADLGATPWQRLRYVTLPILLPGIIGVALFGFTLSYDEFPRTVLTAGSENTLPLEIWALTTQQTSPALFALGTVTTVVSFIVIAVSLGSIALVRRRRARQIGQR
jgi:putative spermidine/putrescine transport system permease protein